MGAERDHGDFENGLRTSGNRWRLAHENDPDGCWLACPYGRTGLGSRHLSVWTTGLTPLPVLCATRTGQSRLVNPIMASPVRALSTCRMGPRRRLVEAARRALSERAFQDVTEIENPLSEAVRLEREERPN
jgi:hypothetical protein